LAAFAALALLTMACDPAATGTGAVSGETSLTLATDPPSPTPQTSASPTDVPGAPSPTQAPAPPVAPPSAPQSPTTAPTVAPTAPPAPPPTAPPTAPPPPPPTQSPNPNALGVGGKVTDQSGASYGGVCVTIGPPIRCATTTATNGVYYVSLDSAPAGLKWDIRFLVSGTVKVERLGVIVSGPVTINATIAR
jgi:hypothetical protein